MTSYPAKDGVVMFPSSHDITPFNLEEYVRVAKALQALTLVKPSVRA